MKPGDKSRLTRNLILLFAVFAASGLTTGLTEPFWNTFYATYGITNVQRGLLEIPRETPGMLIVFITGFTLFMGQARLGAIAKIIQGIGLILLGPLAPTYAWMVAWMVLISLGQHLFMPLASSLPMLFSSRGREGTRLGQLNGVGTAGMVLGSGVVYIGFRWLNLSYPAVFAVAGAALVLSGILMLCLRVDDEREKRGVRVRIVFRREYWVFYALSILSGIRKQLNMFLIPWILINLWGQGEETFAILAVIVALTSTVMHPFIGKMTDRFGERAVMIASTVGTLAVCAGYAIITPDTLGRAGLFIMLALKVVEEWAIASGSARSVYIKRIAREPGDITPSLSLGISLDHIMAVPAPFVAGWVMDRAARGFEWVFYGAAFFTLLYGLFCLFVPRSTLEPPGEFARTA